MDIFWNIIDIGNRVILKLETANHTCLFISSARFLSKFAFLFHHFLEKLQQILVSVVVPALGFISIQ